MANEANNGRSLLPELLANAACILIMLGSIGIAAWILITGQIGKQGIDALFLLAICLLMAFAFSIIPMQAMRRGLFRQLLQRRKEPGE